MYDGENIYPSWETLGTASLRTLEWKTVEDIENKYKLSVPSSSFSTSIDLPEIYPFSGSTPTSNGNKVRWQTNDFGFYAVRYAPQVNPILMTGGYYPITNAQQWQYSNTTLSGSIPQIHDTQDEFYNGEYSGSTIIVSNGELNAGCDAFKHINPTSVPYSIRSYLIRNYTLPSSPYNIPPSYSEDYWLDSNNDPLPGYVSMGTQGYDFGGVDIEVIGYIAGVFPLSLKVSKIDANGTDQSNSLRELKRFQFESGSFSFSPYPPYNPTHFKIGSITEYQSYFLYGANGGTFSSSDRSIPDWSFTGSYTGDGTTKVSGSTRSPELTTHTDNSTVPNVLLDANTHEYTTGTDTVSSENFGMSFNLPTYFEGDLIIEFTGSITASNVESTDGFYLYVNSSTPGSGSSIPSQFSLSKNFPAFFMFTSSADFSSQIYTGSFSGSGIISSSFYAPGTSLGIGMVPNSFDFYSSWEGLLSPIYITSNQWTSSINGFNVKIYSDPSGTLLHPTASSSNNSFDSIPEPFFGQNDFTRAFDCQPLLGNATVARENKFLQDVDYTTDITVPTNIGNIIDGTATKGTVPESNYTILKSINPRYNGSRSTCLEINKWQEDDTGTYGKEPNVESQQGLITYCDWIESSFPERNNTVKAHIQYLIKDDGNVSEPNINKFSTPDLQQTFPQGQNCIINLNKPPEGLGMEILNGTKGITKGGYRIEPLLTLQSGSLYSDTGNVYWDTTGSFTANVKADGVIGDHSAGSISTLSDRQYHTSMGFYQMSHQTLSGSQYSNTNSEQLDLLSEGKYIVSAQAEADGVNLNFEAIQNFWPETGQSSQPVWYLNLQIHKNANLNPYGPDTNTRIASSPPKSIYGNREYNQELSVEANEIPSC